MATGDVEITAGSGTPVCVISKTEDSESRNLQRVAVDGDLMTFGSAIMTAQSASGTESTAVACTGRSRVAFRVSFNDSSASCTFRVAWSSHDGTALWIYSYEFSVPNTGISDGSRYIGEIVVVETYGAKEMKIRIGTCSASDDVTVYGIAV